MAADKENREKGRALKNEREVVLLALLSHEKNETFSNILVRRTLDSCAQMSTVEKAFIKRLLEGVIERKTELDTRIENFTGRSVSRLHPAVRQILRMGIYQIYYMDAVPDSAVCNEAVQLAKRHAPARLSGFVNGVLRNAARQAAAEERRRICPAQGRTVQREKQKRAEWGTRWTRMPWSEKCVWSIPCRRGWSACGRSSWVWRRQRSFWGP
jgi:transcription antitermination factor NusB